MENSSTQIYEPTSKNDKVDSLEVSVTEIEPEKSTPEFDRLTMHSPNPHVWPPPTIVKHSHAHYEPLPLAKLSGDVATYPDITKRHNLPRASSPTGSVRSSFGSSRHVSRALRWSNGFSQSRSYRTKFSKELTAQAESEFFALMELMSGITRRSSSLKDVWTKIISERESYVSRMDQMYEQFEEYSDTIERKEKELQHHHHDHENRKKEVSKLSFELTAATATALECKKKLAERDNELGVARREISEFRDHFKDLKEENEVTKTKLEETQLRLVACDEDRRKAEEDAKKHHVELRSLRQQFVELQNSHTEVTRKYESTHKELISLKQSNTTLKKEKHEWMHDKGELEESLRKGNHRNDELRRKVTEITDLNERKEREVHKLQETVSRTKYESEEVNQKIKDLRRQLEEEHNRWEDAEDQCGKWKLKWEHSDREIVSIRDEFRLIQLEQTELRETIKKKTEELRLAISEKDRMEERYHDACKKTEETHRQVLVLQESMRRTESTLKEKTELVSNLHERIKRIEDERDEARKKCRDFTIELSELQASIISLKLEIETVTEDRENIREKLRLCEAKFEEVCETITEYEEGNSGSEYEITTLRAMLREVREQKEQAISMRNSADKERDDAIVKYEEKCREIEKLEESFSQQSHTYSRSGGRTITRHYINGSRSVSALQEQEQEELQDS